MPDAQDAPAIPPLRPLTEYDDRYFYTNDTLSVVSDQYLTRLDLVTGVQEVACNKPGCTHTGEDAINCDAWLCGPRDGDLSVVCLTDGETLFYIYTGSASQGGRVLSRPLRSAGCRLVGSGFEEMLQGSVGDVRWFTGGGSLYGFLFGYEDGDDGMRRSVTLLVRIPLEEGTSARAEEVFRWEQPMTPDVAVGGLHYEGIADGRLLLCEVIPPAAHTGSLADDAKACRFAMRWLEPDATLGEPVLAGDGSAPTAFALREDGTLLCVDQDTAGVCLRVVGADGGVETVRQNILPVGITLNRAAGCWGDILLLDGWEKDWTPHRYRIDLATWEVQELEGYWFKSGAPEPQLPVITVNAERYLVLVVDNRVVTVTDRGQDGRTYTHPADYAQFAVMETADYLAGSTDWVPCTLMHGTDILASRYQ